jgi:hypothetical protein
LFPTPLQMPAFKLPLSFKMESPLSLLSSQSHLLFAWAGIKLEIPPVCACRVAGITNMCHHIHLVKFVMHISQL